MTEALLGGIGLTHLTVYHEQSGPDGVHAGCAHIHALTPEAYFGVSGEGAIELHDLERGYRRLTIRKGTFVQFPPGTLHRSVSTDHLEVLAIMGNGGLAERGDARIYFGKDVDHAPDEYERLRALVRSGIDGAMARRDASALAYGKLMELLETDKPAYTIELERFINAHRSSIIEKTPAFKQAIMDGPFTAGEQALDHLAALTGGEPNTDLKTGLTNIAEADVVYGMCGTLRQIGSLSPQ